MLLLWTLCALATASELQIQVPSGHATVLVDGQKIETSADGIAHVRDVERGIHLVQVRGLFGVPLAEMQIALAGHERLRLDYRQGALAFEGAMTPPDREDTPEVDQPGAPDTDAQRSLTRMERPSSTPSDPAFDALLAKVQRAPSVAAKHKVLATVDTPLSCQQVAELVKLYATDTDRTNAVRLLREDVEDPENLELITGNLRFSSHRDAVAALF